MQDTMIPQLSEMHRWEKEQNSVKSALIQKILRAFVLNDATSSCRYFFDPTDKQFQIKKEFPPDKESTWKYQAENDGWVHAHNALRRDYQFLN